MDRDKTLLALISRLEALSAQELVANAQKASDGLDSAVDRAFAGTGCRAEARRRRSSSLRRRTPRRPGPVGELEAANVKFPGRVENTWLFALLSWILPTPVFVGAAELMRRRRVREQDREAPLRVDGG
jgi:hypothetical protein